jgi:tRNA nucleotidyltransferase (CCA-adding enzyme)
VADRIISEITKAAVCCDVQCRPMLVGSCARGTWLSGDYDLDIFLAVPPNRELTSALLPARMVAKVYEERYASHPYIHAMIDGFEVDLVPCFDLQDAKNIESAVDRSPFHNRYVAGRIAGHEDDVLLLKQFMKGVGVYGSEQRLGGFSGYLSELLVLQYGSFKGVLEAASCFHPGQVIDLENHSSLSHSDPLVVVDPVDPKRNVAAALTIDRLFQFSAASRCFLAAPDIDFFFPPESKPLETSELLRLMKERGTMFILVEFMAPDVVEDVLFPQLKKADASITALLSRHGFSVMRSDFEVSVDKKIAWLLFELDVFRLPSVEKRVGPPAHAVAHLSRF